MAKYSNSSSAKLSTCIKPLQNLFLNVVDHYDNKIICGLRSKEDQAKAKRNNASNVDFPNSKHNGLAPKYDESYAVDAAPYPIPNGWGEINAIARNEISLQWKDRVKFYEFAAIVKYEWAKMQACDKDLLSWKLTWGGDWDSDNDYKDNQFDDLVHFQMTEVKKPKSKPKFKMPDPEDD